MFSESRWSSMLRAFAASFACNLVNHVLDSLFLTSELLLILLILLPIALLKWWGRESVG